MDWSLVRYSIGKGSIARGGKSSCATRRNNYHESMSYRQADEYTIKIHFVCNWASGADVAGIDQINQSDVYTG
jgi:hypothetical protein